jgi:glycosyltransferase involved in cell wall biosynthesis
MVFVLNTGYEGLPHTVLEAMAMGTPVAVSAIGGNPELVEDQKTGLTFRYEDKEQIKQAILKIYQDKALAWAMVKNAKKLLEKFTLENMISQINQLLKSS